MGSGIPKSHSRIHPIFPEIDLCFEGVLISSLFLRDFEFWVNLTAGEPAVRHTIEINERLSKDLILYLYYHF